MPNMFSGMPSAAAEVISEMQQPSWLTKAHQELVNRTHAWTTRPKNEHGPNSREKASALAEIGEPLSVHSIPAKDLMASANTSLNYLKDLLNNLNKHSIPPSIVAPQLEGHIKAFENFLKPYEKMSDKELQDRLPREEFIQKLDDNFKFREKTENQIEKNYHKVPLPALSPDLVNQARTLYGKPYQDLSLPEKEHISSKLAEAGVDLPPVERPSFNKSIFTSTEALKPHREELYRYKREYRSGPPTPPLGGASSSGAPAPRSSAHEALFRAWANIAPLTPMHEEGKERIRQSMAGTGAHNRLQEHRLEALSRIHPTGRMTEELEHSRPQGLENYMAPYEDLIDTMQRSGERQWEEDIAPRISNWYTMHGATRGGAAPADLAKSYLKHQEGIREGITKLRTHAFESARGEAHLQQQLALQRANAFGEAGKAEHLAAAQQLDLGARHGAAKKLQEQMDANALFQIGQAEQAQHDREIRERERQREREENEERENIAFEQAILKGAATPMTTAQRMEHYLPSPIPPNAPAILGGLTGALAGMSTGSKAHGGRIRSHFAGGGLPHLGEQQQLAQSLANRQFDPIKNWMSRAGSRLLANSYGGRHPMQGLAEAHELAHNDQLAHEDKKAHGKAQAGDLYYKMHASLMNQNRLMKEMEAQKARQALEEKKFGEMARHNRVNEALTERGMGMREAAAVAPKPFGTADKKAIREAKHNITAALEGLKLVKQAKDVFRKLNTGPFASKAQKWIPGATLSGIVSGMGGADDISKANVITNKLIELGAKGMKGTSKAHLARVEGSKMSVENTPEANELSAEMWEDAFKEALADNIHDLEDIGYSPEQIENYLQEKEEKKSQINAHHNKFTDDAIKQLGEIAFGE